ncbi:nitroreductase family protein [bacterium]|nr:nitroreductase family protein [bacterium]
MNLTTIAHRRSVRTFTGEPLSADHKEAILAFAGSENVGPFKNRIRFHLLDVDGRTRADIQRLTTYGTMKHAPHYLAAVVPDNPRAMEDLGFVMERLILYATSLGIGTCWIGGLFKRSALAEELQVTAAELLPAMTPLGYAAARRSLTERALRAGAGSNRRKPWSDLFFRGRFDTPLLREQAGAAADALEAVRLAPSASNKQPWRIVIDQKKGAYHFFLSRSRGYDKMAAPISLQEVDMGIAMYHFDCVMDESGATGTWVLDIPDMEFHAHEYIITWKQKNRSE